MRITFGKALVATAMVVGASLGAAHDARATLGGDVTSIVANQKTFAATHDVTKLAAGERHELVLPSGIVVREYVSPSGAVYAITWRGPRKPDLRTLLGAYFAQIAQTTTSGGHHRASTKGADLRITSTGHGHSFSGRAWVPSLVPADVKVDGSLQ
jgi:hypothetical protein